MHYLIMIYADESSVPDLPPEEIQKITEAVDVFDVQITDAGRNLGSIRLQPAASAETLRLREGKPLRTDGPFAETKEQLGGIYIIEAADMDKAAHLAGHLPMTSYGAVEVRPVLGIELRQAVAANYDG